MGTSLQRELGAGDDLLTSATARGAAVARAHERCRSVIAPSRVWREPNGAVVVSFPVAPGASLAEVRAGRALSVGECVTVGVGVADALAALHAERVAHGDVSAANVVVSGRRVALVDTMGALCEERGTPGFAAPERAMGASPAGDVFALGMLLRWLADAQAVPVIDAWTAPLLVANPNARPSAAHAAAALARCAPAMAIRAPEAPVVAAMRASAVVRTVRRKEDTWWHVQKASVRLAPLAGLAALAVISGAALVPAMAQSRVPFERANQGVEAPATSPVGVAAFVTPQAAAASLARRRVDAMAAGDGAELLALSAPESPSATADAAIAEELDDRSMVFTNLALNEVDTRLVRTTPGGAIVEVTTTLSDYGVGNKRVPRGTATATVELVLTQRGWLVQRILPQP